MLRIFGKTIVPVSVAKDLGIYIGHIDQSFTYKIMTILLKQSPPACKNLYK